MTITINNGEWTPATIDLAIEVMEDMINKPSSLVVSNPKKGANHTLQAIRNNLVNRRYSNLEEWKSDFNNFVEVNRKEDELSASVCDEFELFFRKKYAILEKFSKSEFNDYISNIVNELSEISNDLSNSK